MPAFATIMALRRLRALLVLLPFLFQSVLPHGLLEINFGATSGSIGAFYGDMVDPRVLFA